MHVRVAELFCVLLLNTQFFVCLSVCLHFLQVSLFGEGRGGRDLGARRLGAARAQRALDEAAGPRGLRHDVARGVFLALDGDRLDGDRGLDSGGRGGREVAAAAAVCLECGGRGGKGLLGSWSAGAGTGADLASPRLVSDDIVRTRGDELGQSGIRCHLFGRRASGLHHCLGGLVAKGFDLRAELLEPVGLCRQVLAQHCKVTAHAGAHVGALGVEEGLEAPHRRRSRSVHALGRRPHLHQNGAGSLGGALHAAAAGLDGRLCFGAD